MGEAFYKLRTGKLMKMKEVLYVSGLKNNLLSISTLDKKGFKVAYVDGEVLVCPEGRAIDDAIVIGVEEGGLYKLKGLTNLAFISNTISPSELWHRLLLM